MAPGKLPGSNSPAVPFSEPENPYPAGTTSASTNLGRAVNTLDRSMPLGPADGDPGAPLPGAPTFGGTWLGEWSKGR
jgi:hypothetical protein